MKQPLKIAHKKPSISLKYKYLDRKKNNVDRSIASKTQDYSEFAFGNISIRLGEIFCKPSSEAITRRLLLTIYYLLTSYTPDRAFCPSINTSLDRKGAHLRFLTSNEQFFEDTGTVTF